MLHHLCRLNLLWTGARWYGVVLLHLVFFLRILTDNLLNTSFHLHLIVDDLLLLDRELEPYLSQLVIQLVLDVVEVQGLGTVGILSNLELNV